MYFVCKLNTLLKVGSHYDLRVLYMSVKGFQKKFFEKGRGGVNSQVFGIF